MKEQPAVLYVEDDSQNRMVMDILLREEMGLPAVEIFEDSHDFEARLNSLPFQPDIILLDIHVEPMDGFEMLKVIRNNSQFSNVPVLAVTASVMNEEVKHLKTAGFDGAVAKPIHIETFPQLLEQVLDGRAIWNIL